MDPFSKSIDSYIVCTVDDVVILFPSWRIVCSPPNWQNIPSKDTFENILDVKFQLELLILSSAVDNHTELAKHTEAQVGIILEYLVKL